MRWFIRLPRYGRRLAGLNRNGIDIERRPRCLRSTKEISLESLLECLREAAQYLRANLRIPPLPLLLRPTRPLTSNELPHVPRGTPLEREG